MPDLSALTNSSSTAQSLSNLILVTPSSNQGLTSQVDKKTFLFDYEGENSISLESDVTDHTIENNSTIQDHVSLKPEMINVTGFIAELNDIPPPGLALLKQAADRLLLLAPFTPGLSISALQAYNNTALLYSTAQSAANSAVSTWASIGGGVTVNPDTGAVEGSPPQKDPETGLILPNVQTKQQIAFVKFYGYWQQRTFFTVQTPWAIFDNMLIKNLRAIQDEETRMVSSFEITFKKIRFATTITLRPKLAQGRLKNQKSLIADNGVSTGTPGAPLTNQIITSGIPA